MTKGLRKHLEGMGYGKRQIMAQESRNALRFAWPHRHTLRGRTIVLANVAMLRNLRAV